jgi:ferric enterobactin receptor
MLYNSTIIVLIYRHLSRNLFVLKVFLFVYMAILFLNTEPSFSQTLIRHETSFNTIKGVVADSVSYKPLGYVTVIIYDSEDKKIIKSTSTNDLGRFDIRGIDLEKYHVILTYIGYRTKTIKTPSFTSPTLDLGTIYLTSTATQLQEVQVTAQRPLVEMSTDKTIYHVESDPEVNFLSTFDMLRKVPMLMIDADDNIMLNGQNNYQILVNGKRSTLFTASPGEVLKGLPASSIKQIEIITNPSARYEAAGTGGVINIITHKRSISGYNGSLTLNAGNPESYNGSASLTATRGKFGFTGRYSNNYTNRPGNTSSFYRIDHARESRLEQIGNGSSIGRAQNIGGQLSWDLSPYDQLTATFGLNNNNSTGNQIQQVSQLSAGGETTASYQNINNSNNEGSNSDISLGYQRSFKNSDARSLSLDLNLSNSDNEASSDFSLKPLINYTGRQSTTQSRDIMREYSLQADYVQPLGKHALELGVSSILQESSSDYYYKNLEQETGAFAIDAAMSNSFDYRQDIHAAYASLNLRSDKWSLRTGIRLEETMLSANFRSSATKAKQQYRNLFPNITLTRMLKESGNLKLSYSQRIQRPGLYDLNPYVDATDPLNISYGNADLDPATSHVLQLEYSKYIKTTSFTASLSHHFTNDAIQYFTILGEDSVARSTYGNLGRDRRYSFLIGSNTTLFSKVSLGLNAMTNYIKYQSAIEGNEQTREGFTYNARANVNYRFAKNWRMSGNISYNSPNLMLQGRTAGYTWSSLSLNKQFLKNEKASIGLSVRSPFQKYRRSVSEVDNPRFYQYRESYSIMRQYSLAFSYRFGKLR